MWQFFNNKEFLAAYKIIPFSLYKLACLKTQQPDLKEVQIDVFLAAILEFGQLGVWKEFLIVLLNLKW